MAAPRFYVEVETEALDKALAEQAEVVLPPKAAHHAGRALRLRTGEETVVFNGTGRQWRRLRCARRGRDARGRPPRAHDARAGARIT